MLTRATFSIARFQEEDRGTVAVMFGLMLTVLGLFAGLAIDYGRITNVHSSISGAADAASLAGGKAMLQGKLSDSEVIELAEKYFQSNSLSSSKIGRTSKPQIAINRETGKVSVKVDSVVPLTIGRLSGIESMTVPVASEAIFQQKDIEVGMALDVTGSMNNRDSAGQRKIDGLKQAFKQFADELLPDNSYNTNSVRIGLAPYSSGINLGPFAAGASANLSTDGCVSESKGASPSDDRTTYYVQKRGDRDPRSRGEYLCPSSQLESLSDDKDALIEKVNGFTAAGSTSGHFGTQWAWNLVSDKWSLGPKKADSYDKVREEKLVKAVVLMTDGLFNTAFHGDTSKNQVLGLCRAMRDKGVLVLTVGFETPSEPADRATLEACATPGAGHFAIASDARQLEAIFKNFASLLTNLRVTR